MMLDRLSHTYCAAPMRGHRTYTNIPPFRRLAAPAEAPNAAFEARGGKAST